MVQLVYASAATRPFSPSELATLLEKARARNSFYDISGMLLYHNGSFLQVLEGPEDHVAKVFASIERDKRHNNTKVLNRAAILRREFDVWAMGFADTSNIPSSAPGLLDYHRTVPKLTVGGGEARRYLRFFQDGLCRQQAS